MLGGLIANVKLSLTLRRRRKVRIIEGERIRQGKRAAQLRAWANDPLRRAA
jgi:hypothetical protein